MKSRFVGFILLVPLLHLAPSTLAEVRVGTKETEEDSPQGKSKRSQEKEESTPVEEESMDRQESAHRRSASNRDVPGAEWELIADPRKLGWSAQKLAEAHEYADTLNTEAVMIIVGGKVLAEWGTIDEKYNVHSIRKSLLSALYGVQVGKGKISLDSTMEELGIDDNEPALTDDEKAATIGDLLKARSGIYHSALYETAWMKAGRPKRHSHAPGEFWYYNNWDFNALGTIYEQETGADIFADFKKRIADPIGMEDFEEGDGGYLKGKDSIHAAYPVRMTARDMARFGLLYLRGGRWAGKQVVPAEWVTNSTTSYSRAGGSGGYGYLWWVSVNGKHLPGVVLPEGSFSAQGAGGHYILVVPSLDLVIVHRVNTDQADTEVSSADFGQLVRLILAAHTLRVVQ